MFTMCQRRTAGSPSTSSSFNWPTSNSSDTVCSDMNAIPMPAITACLIVSLLFISINTAGSM